MRACTGCLVMKPFEDFGWHNEALNKRRARCKACVAAHVRDRRRDDPALRLHHLRLQRLSRYRLTEEALIGMWEDQGRACAICTKFIDINGGANSYAVDHDHGCCPEKRSCGKCVRGLLCPPCNQGLGQLGDNIDTMRAAIDYLNRAALRVID